MGKRYLVSVVCGTCNKTFAKDKYLLKTWKGDCQPCSAVKVCKSFIGTKRSEQHRIRTGLASLGRRNPKLAEIAKKQRGSLNSRWNPDREAVARNERVRKEMYSLVHNTLKRLGIRKLRKSADVVGYTAQELFDHLTQNFKPGMSWERREEWHIDHVKPVSVFVSEGITDPKIINALRNLQPLWKFDNMSKGGANRPGTNWTVMAK